MTKNQPELYESALYKMLLENLPVEYLRNEDRLDMVKITEKLGYSQYTVWRWFVGKHFGKKSIKAIVQLSNDTTESDKKGLITAEMLYPFMMQS